MILILGNLYINDEVKKKFNALDENVIYIDKPYDGIEEVISKAKYICACNFNLNKYIDYLNSDQYIVMAETGIVNIDVLKAEERNLNICNLENYSCDAVVQYIMYCIIKQLRPWNLYFQNESMKNEIMDKKSIGMEKVKFGVVGYGTIGKSIAKVLNALNCEVYVKSRKKIDTKYATDVTMCDLFEKCDVIIICCNLNSTSRKMIDYKLLNKLKHNSTLVSISQIEIFNEADLNSFLKERKDIKAYLDFDFNDKISELNKQKNVNISPHVAFFTQQTIINRTEACIEKIRNHISYCDKEMSKIV